MQIHAKAVVFRGDGSTVRVEDITVEPPGPNEVMLKIAACGVCHSDLSVTNGTLPLPPPIVLGHESAGVVAQVGDGVTDLKVGDHVITSFVATCGRCRYCSTGRPQLCDIGTTAVAALPGGKLRTRDAQGQPLNVMAACGVMAEYATLHETSVVKIVDTVPLDRCALIGCGVMTGWGAVCNTAKVEPGSDLRGVRRRRRRPQRDPGLRERRRDDDRGRRHDGGQAGDGQGLRRHAHRWMHRRPTTSSRSCASSPVAARTMRSSASATATSWRRRMAACARVAPRWWSASHRRPT